MQARGPVRHLKAVLAFTTTQTNKSTRSERPHASGSRGRQLRRVVPDPCGSRLVTMGKAKPAKHTAAEISAKVKAATTNMGGGKAGLQDRKGGAVGHAKYKCPICMTAAPDLKSMQLHWENRHPKLPFEAEKCEDLHAMAGGVTTQGVAIRGSRKK